MSVQEWGAPYNPFNSMKALVHADKFKSIVNGNFQSPVVINIDPSNRCNFSCRWCMARKHREDNKAGMLSKTDMINIVSFISEQKIPACCIAGGGEPTLNKDSGYLVEQLKRCGVDIGFVTNGYLLTPELAFTLARCCRFVGFSMDAGYAKTYSFLKKVPENYFGTVLENILMLSIERNKAGSNMRIGYKYLAHPDNIDSNEIYEAIKTAKYYGADDFHLRPLLTDREFFDNKIIYTEKMIESVVNQINAGRNDFENSNFKVYGIMHKFYKSQFKKKHNFKKCMATPLTTTWTSEGDVYLCVDRRGDESLKLCSYKDKNEVSENWNSRKHHDMIKAIDIKECPRCTNGPYNEFFEQIFCDEDPMMYNLI